MFLLWQLIDIFCFSSLQICGKIVWKCGSLAGELVFFTIGFLCGVSVSRIFLLYHISITHVSLLLAVCGFLKKNV